MKKIEIGKLSLRVCEHQGDINYLRFVKFKQWAPQFWEKMDSPLFETYFKKYRDLHNQGKYAESVMIWYDYQMAIKQSEENSIDAWGICFSLLSIEEGEDERSCPDDENYWKAKVNRFSQEGLLAETVKESVINFMQASPEVFSDHLMLYVLPSLRKGTVK